MTLGENIKNYRTKANLTQKDLSEKLNVSYQTISKRENNTNEPDVATLKQLCSIFNCSLDDLLNYDKEEDKPIEKENVVITPPTKIQIGTCSDCKKELYSGDIIHHVDRKSEHGVKETVEICDDCFKIHEELNEQRKNIEANIEEDRKESTSPFRNIIKRNDRKVIVWAIVAGIFSLAITLVLCILYYNNVGLALTIALPLIVGYTLFADVYCIFTGSWVGEVFLAIASWSVKFPGIIFTFDLDGLKFLIFMKILFGILGVLISIAAFLFALAFSSICSIFTFPILIIYNKTHY